jgi:hypothetical protein
MASILRILAGANVLAALIALLTAIIGGFNVRAPLLQDLLSISHPRYGALFSRMIDTTQIALQYPYPTESFPSASQTGKTGLINEFNCVAMQMEFVTNTKEWGGCHGGWMPANESLVRNVDFRGYYKPSVEEELTCDTDNSAYPFASSWVQPQDSRSHLMSVADWGRKILARNYYRDTPEAQNMMFEACMAPKQNGYMSVYFVLGTMLFTMAASFACLVAPTSVDTGRGPSIFSALTVMILLSTYFYSTMHSEYMSRVQSKAFDCRDIEHRGTMAPEDYYAHVPNNKCYVSREDSMCEAFPPSNENAEVQLCTNKDLTHKDIFVMTVDAMRNCAQYTTKCNDPNTLTTPSFPVVGSDIREDYPGNFDSYLNKTVYANRSWCALCTHGPRWSTASINSLKTVPFGKDWSGFGTSSKADKTKPCMWVHDKLPVLTGDGKAPTMEVKANNCVNRFDLVRKIDTHSCSETSVEKDSDGKNIQSYTDFLFEYGHPSKCHATENRPETGHRLNGIKYPDCVYANFEKCYVKRSSTADFQYKLSETTKKKVYQKRGGIASGPNTCVLNYSNVTTCFCSCSEYDYQTKRCERTRDGIGIMFDNHTNGVYCRNSETCAPNSGNKFCDFLGDDNQDESLKRYVVEKSMCSTRQTKDPELSTYCISKIQTGGKYFILDPNDSKYLLDPSEPNGAQYRFQGHGEYIAATVRTVVEETLLFKSLLAQKEGMEAGTVRSLGSKFELGYYRSIKNDGSAWVDEGKWSDGIKEDGVSLFKTFINILPLAGSFNPSSNAKSSTQLSLCVMLETDPYTSGRYELKKMWCDPTESPEILQRKAPWASMCAIDTEGTCVSHHVECNDEQAKYFAELKEYNLQSIYTPPMCMTNQEGQAVDKAGMSYLSNVQTVSTGISFLLFTSCITALMVLVLNVTKPESDNTTTATCTTTTNWNQNVVVPVGKGRQPMQVIQVVQ